LHVPSLLPPQQSSLPRALSSSRRELSSSLLAVGFTDHRYRVWSVTGKKKNNGTRQFAVADFRFWHEPDQPYRSGYVRSEWQSGSGAPGLSGPALTQLGHFRTHGLRRRATCALGLFWWWFNAPMYLPRNPRNKAAHRSLAIFPPSAITSSLIASKRPVATRKREGLFRMIVMAHEYWLRFAKNANNNLRLCYPVLCLLVICRIARSRRAAARRS